VLHLWLYRRGRDALGGVSLALAICLKMTPALFVLYWAYQRCWKLLVWTAVALVIFAVVIPAGVLGPQRYADVTGTWLENLIVPGLVKGAWYPIHINQSIPGVFARYLLGEPNPNGDIFWNPDDNDYEYQDQHGWIAVAWLSDGTVKWLIRLAQVVVLGLAAWAIGLRKLPRDDGRRALHYGLIVCGMMLLNQRTWDHHAGVLLIANVAAWYAIGFARIGRRARVAAFGLMALVWPLVWLVGSGTFKLAAQMLGHGRDAGEIWADYADAYGPTFLSFVALFAACVVLSAALRTSRSPYHVERCSLRSGAGS